MLGALACRIDHNGSTVVPGLEAKPIIDIQVLATLVNAEDPSSREAYANATSEFIGRVVQMALAAGLPRGL